MKASKKIKKSKKAKKGKKAKKSQEKISMKLDEIAKIQDELMAESIGEDKKS